MNEPWNRAWYDVGSPDAFGGLRRLFHRYPQHRTAIKKWSEKQEGYTLHKQPRRHYLRRQILVPFVDFQFEVDLIDLSSYAKYNDGVRFLLVCIDRLSRKIYVKTLRDKRGESVAEALDSIFQEKRPWKVLSDRGLEWRNKHVKAVCEKWDVQQYFCRDPVMHCPMVERVNRTLKQRLARYATSFNSRRYVDVLEDIVRGYNHSVHRAIGMRPVDVTRGAKEAEAYRNMLRGRARMSQRGRPAPLNEGDRVRVVLPFRAPFDKGYDLSWSRQIYSVADRVSQPHQPDVYWLRDDNNKEQPLTYYREELQRVIDPEEYAVERVLESRMNPTSGRREYKVRWLGYGPQFDSWVEQVWQPQREVSTSR